MFFKSQLIFNNFLSQTFLKVKSSHIISYNATSLLISMLLYDKLRVLIEQSVLGSIDKPSLYSYVLMSIDAAFWRRVETQRLGEMCTGRQVTPCYNLSP